MAALDVYGFASRFEVLRAVRHVAVALNADGEVMWANDFALETTGRRAHGILGRAWLDVCDPRDRPALAAALAPRESGDANPQPAVGRVLSTAGGVRTFLWSFTRLPETVEHAGLTLVIGQELAGEASSAAERGDGAPQAGGADDGASVAVEPTEEATWSTQRGWQGNAHDWMARSERDGRARLRPYLRRVHPDDRDMVVAHLRRLLTGASVQARLLHRVLRKGRYAWTIAQAEALVAASAGSDITLRVSFQTDIEPDDPTSTPDERTRFFEKLLANAPGAAFQLALGANGGARLPYASPGWKETFGLAPEDLVTDASALKARVHADDLLRLRMDLGQSAHELGPIRGVYRFAHPQRGQRWLLVTGQPERARNGDTVWYGHAVDITEQIEARQTLATSEALWRLAVEGTGASVWIWDPIQDSVVHEPELGSANGTGRRVVSTFDQWLLRVHPEDREAFLVALETSLDDGPSLFDVTHRMRTAAGGFLWVRSRARLVPGEDSGYNDRVVGTIRDVSVEEELERTLVTAREAADRASGMKAAFLRRVGHELRTPLNSILGFAQLLEVMPLPMAAASHVGSLLASARHLHDLVERLVVLTGNELDASGVSVAAESASFSELEAIIAAVLRDHRALATANDVRLVRTAAPVQRWVRGSPKQIAGALSALVVNAIMYGGRGSEARIEVVDAPGGRVRVLVSDSGPGIAPDLMERLFEPFDRLGQETGRAPGVGLSLAGARSMVAGLGGRLSAASAVGTGTTFHLELPSLAAESVPLA